MLLFFPTMIAAILIASIGTSADTRPISAGDIALATTTLHSATTPVLAPTIAPTTFATDRLSTHVGEPYTDSNGYIVVIGETTNCFSNECAYSIIMGEQGPLDHNEREGEIVTLPNGQSAYYQNVGCNDCKGWSSLKFGNRTEHYSVAVQGGSYAELLAVVRGLKRLH